jgi:hypothetical protein
MSRRSNAGDSNSRFGVNQISSLQISVVSLFNFHHLISHLRNGFAHIRSLYAGLAARGTCLGLIDLLCTIPSRHCRNKIHVRRSTHSMEAQRLSLNPSRSHEKNGGMAHFAIYSSHVTRLAYCRLQEGYSLIMEFEIASWFRSSHAYAHGRR